MGTLLTPSDSSLRRRHGVAVACLAGCLGMVVVASLTARQSAVAAPPEGFRRLAPGTLIVIPSDASADDLSSRADLTDITVGLAKTRSWTPLRAAANTTLLERGKDREYRREAWCLEFAYKPPRMIDVDVPVAGEKMRRKRVWYLLYRVKNVGGRRTKVAEDGTRATETFELPIRFLPQFVLETREPLSEAEGLASFRSYLDRVVPAAMLPIERRERPAGKLHDSASISAEPMTAGEERWGVAVWEDIDPRIDFFSVYVRGLTNAIRWRPRPPADVPAGAPPGATEEQTLESLRLDFWRQGDDEAEVDEEMSVGFAGMFERITLGSRLLDAIGRQQIVKTDPIAGFAALGLSWSDLLEPTAGDGMSSLVPLERVIRKIAALPDPATRAVVVKQLFGELGPDHFEDLARGLVGPADADRDAARRGAMAAIKMRPETAAAKPLVAVADVVRGLEAAATVAERRRQSLAFFGDAGRRIESLARELAADRTIAVLDELDVARRVVAANDALGAFDVIQVAVGSRPEAEDRKKLLQGLFGSLGPELYAGATVVHQGIDHAWVFRYDSEEGFADTP